MIYEFNKKNISLYSPPKKVEEFTAIFQRDYNTGMEILQRSWTELNNRSVLQDDQHGKMMFNAFVNTESEDPNESWRYKGTRSEARNKGVATHAQLTQNFLLPSFVAQNDDDELDEGFSEVMQDAVEWMAQPNVSNYQKSFFQVALSMLQSPVVYLGAEFYEVYTKNRKLNKDVLDEVLSGFQCPIWSCNQILIANAFERNIQKQRFIIKRRYCEYEELKKIYGEHENWKFVQQGIRSVFNDDDGLFYDVKDDEHPMLVAEEVWCCRGEDLEIPYLNGIYMGKGDPESNENYIRHRDNKDNPKYNVIPFGYARIGDHFFYFKSQMNCMQWDNAKVDAMDELVMNRAILDVDQPLAVFGVDPHSVNSAVVFPKSVAVFESKDAKVSPLLPSANISSGLAMLQQGKEGTEDTSGINDTIQGQLPEASQKAYNVAQADANSKRLLMNVAKALAESVVQYGDLMKDIFINHYSTAEVQEIAGKTAKLKYRSLFLSSRDATGNKIDKTIKFDESLIGLELTDGDKMKEALRRLEKTKFKDGKEEDITWVNPALFAKYKYLCKADVQEMFKKDSDYWQQLLIQLKGLMTNDPYVKMDEIDKEIFKATFQSKGDKFMKEEIDVAGIPNQVMNNPAPQPVPGQQNINPQQPNKFPTNL